MGKNKKVNDIKSILNNQIEEWIYNQLWYDEEEVATEIALTNAIFDEIYCEKIIIKDTDQKNKYHFEAEITMYGKPRKDDVPFCGDTIDINVKGTVIVNNDNLDNLTIKHEEIVAKVSEWWSESISIDSTTPFINESHKILERKFNAENLDKLFNILSNFPSHFWFRGQSDELWALKPSIARVKKPSLKLEKALRAEFQNQSAFLDSIGPLSDDIEKITFLMQHHKVPTRLLDWTTAPLIALYFSVCETSYKDHSTENSCIWVLDPKALNKTYKKPFPLLLQDKEVKELYDSGDSQMQSLAIHAPYTNLRMRMQKSEFTIHTTYETMENYKYNTTFLKEKIIISKEVKEKILKKLHNLGIDQCFLFPDLDNIGLGVTKKILQDQDKEHI